MKVTVVNEKDEIIGYKDRDNRSQDDIIRVAGLWIVNSQNEILIAQRAFTKKIGPGKWGPSAAGTVEEGETYESNIVKETKEELGITIKESDLTKCSYRFAFTEHKYFRTVYFTRLDISIEEVVIPKDEVEQVQWISMSDLLDWLQKKPEDFLQSFPVTLRDLRKFI